MKKRGNFQRTALIAALLGLAIAAGAKNLPAPRSLEENVRHQLAMLPYYTVFDELAFRVDGNVVTLLGEVTKPVLKSDAANAIKHVEGVARVDNQIEVLPLSPLDNQIRRQAYFAIFGYGPLERYGMGTQPSIRILVKNGNITLAGIVANEMDRNLAYMRANRIPGVFSVTNDLVVER
jgi:hyperosmotically inducible periplasmic protein